jgi:hypothetical protein
MPHDRVNEVGGDPYLGSPRLIASLKSKHHRVTFPLSSQPYKIALELATASIKTKPGLQRKTRRLAGSRVNVSGQTAYWTRVVFCFVYLALFVSNELHPAWAESFLPPWNGLLRLGSLLFVVASPFVLIYLIILAQRQK